MYEAIDSLAGAFVMIVSTAEEVIARFERPFGESEYRTPGSTAVVGQLRHLDVSGDVVYGTGRDASTGAGCLVEWAIDALPRCLDVLPFAPEFRAQIWAIDDDSHRIVLSTGIASGPTSFIWDSETGVVETVDYLVDHIGVDAGDLQELRATGLSADGRVLVGSAVTPDLTPVVWRAILDPGCSDGFDNDGDGAADFPEDPGCETAGDRTEEVRESVVVDLEPGSHPNRLPLGGNASTWVAILGSEALDVGDVDATSLVFGPDRASPAVSLEHPILRKWFTVDINADGYTDLLSIFMNADLGLSLPDDTICMQGEIAGDVFEACDTVEPVVGGCGDGSAIALVLPVVWSIRRWRGWLTVPSGGVRPDRPTPSR